MINITESIHCSLMRYVIQYICFHNASKKQKIIIKNDCNTDGSGKCVSRVDA